MSYFSRHGSGGAASAYPTLPPTPEEPEEDILTDHENEETGLCHHQPYAKNAVEAPDQYRHATVESHAQSSDDLQNEVVTTSTKCSNANEADTVLPLRPRSRSSTISTEPFPDLDASMSELPSLAYRAQEEAYKHAMGKVAEEILRMNEIRDHIIAIRGPASSVEDEELARSRSSMIVLEGVRPCPEVSHHDHFCVQQEAHKRAMHERVDQFLKGREDVPKHFGKRFSAVTSMIVHMEFILFRSKNFPRDPLNQASENDLKTVFHYTTKIIEYFSAVGGLIFRERNNAERARVLISQVAAKTGVTLLDRFKEMAAIIIQYLKRARRSEQNFFEIFQQFFEVWLYDDFHVMYNNYLVEHMPNIPPNFQRLSYLLNATYNMLGQMIRDYEALGKINRDIGDRFIRPVVDQMARGDNLYGNPINEPAYPACEHENKYLLALSRSAAERHQSEVHRELAFILGHAQTETGAKHHVNQARSPTVLSACFGISNDEAPQDHAHGLGNRTSQECRAAHEALHYPFHSRVEPHGRRISDRLGPSDVPLVYRSSPFIVRHHSNTLEQGTLSRPYPMPDGYRHDNSQLPEQSILQSSYTSAQMFSSQSSHALAAGSSRSDSLPVEHGKDDTCGVSDTDYAPPEAMTSLKFNRCWEETHRPNSKASLSSYAGHPQTGDAENNGGHITRHGTLNEHLRGHTSTEQSEATSSHSAQSSRTQSYDESKPQCQQDDCPDEDILDLNAAEEEEDEEAWLRHDYIDYRHRCTNTFAARLEALAHIRRQNSIENGEYEDPSNNVPSFAASRPRPSGYSISRSMLQFQYPAYEDASDQDQALERRVVARDDNNSPILPPMPEHPRFAVSLDSDEDHPVPVGIVRPQPRPAAMPIALPCPVTRRGLSSDCEREREVFIYEAPRQNPKL
ncbi:predicted protein [Aspergillus nidulans FGSC A4]|uniref:Uncharacterized protein n=1 Tax=Emericella nidulans (strain FGSC A4 / ATCC 38163 / CBS 112.46 / NRRL 194 / M139) TaxID=227321 RepID=Q5AYA6_EMENI|nr:hypothetical protein [Aspergillus nidulans FGSC A4]EAA58542.1 predicted protein [Aspergillus nidulans FGSC A4]CBF71333.1 TPA: conserved hypothetical protein [Aspergillus nidulans FGSC A4]|eukprot:XP_664328.1 predicted protein [Aspergillus nidulans FGSC A4]